ncbi:hypothetical protein KSP39_PZI016506 [Platanthera zijinensis]|uniref:Uncharacterized protein n=1 Tax=Platanthera zijinensis TaxID=2320716 RepID=A0AAP0B806_9ASPA
MQCCFRHLVFPLIKVSAYFRRSMPQNHCYTPLYMSSACRMRQYHASSIQGFLFARASTTPKPPPQSLRRLCRLTCMFTSIIITYILYSTHFQGSTSYNHLLEHDVPVQMYCFSVGSMK